MPSNKLKRIVLRGDGENGLDAEPGIDGFDGDPTENDTLHGTHGSPASEAEHGEDGTNIELTLTTLQNEQGKPMVKIHAITPKNILLDEFYSLSSVPLIKWSAVGGNGGDGADGGRGGDGCHGQNGRDAAFPDVLGTDGKNGGNGGQGGSASGGADGGNGGTFKIFVKERDLFLLMAVDPCSWSRKLLKGGEGGKAGKHGTGGRGGKGGKGGKSLNTVVDENGKKSKRKIPGGADGMDGANGLVPTWEVEEGKSGIPGTFEICVADATPDGKQIFSERYKLKFQNLTFEGRSPLANPAEVEFGDVVRIGNIKVKNVGEMPLPSQQEIHFKIKDTGDPNISPLATRRTAYLPAGSSCAQFESKLSEGCLQFFAGYPGEVEDEYDFNPLKLTAYFHLQAVQYGPRQATEKSSPFVREYPEFHTGEGVRVHFRYPIENEHGLKAVRSLHPGETTIVSLPLENVGANPIGGFDPLDTSGEIRRRLAVRFFLLKSRLYDIPNDKVKFSTHSPLDDDDDEGESIDLKTSNPKLYDVEEIASGDTGDFQTKLSMAADIPFYSKMALIVDVFIETLPIPRGVQVVQEKPKDGMPPMSVIQRRKLEFICEPRFEENKHSKVVLVTSVATTKSQYENWTKHVLEDTLGLEYEVYSISRYGSLDPFFKLENGKFLRDVLKNKLVILLMENFKAKPRDDIPVSPIDLLPFGCMQQCSGFEPTTRWLVVGTNDDVHKKMLRTHLVKETTVEGDYPDVSTFQKNKSRMLEERAEKGRAEDDIPIRTDIISVSIKGSDAVKKLKKESESLASWLRSQDPLSQYTLEYIDVERDEMSEGSNGSKARIRRANFMALRKKSSSVLVIRRGYSRAMNSVVCVVGRYTSEGKTIRSKGMIMSVAEAMSKEMRIKVLCEAIRLDFPDETIRAFTFAAVSDMIRESIIFLDCEMKMNEDLELSFPSIGECLESLEFLSLIRDCKSDTELRERTRRVLSDLLARFELVANSKDLRPKFNLAGRTKKTTTKKSMTEIVERLRIQWKSVIDSDLVDQRKKQIKDEIKEFLQEDSGSKSVNYRADRKWLQGLNYLHSTANDAAFGIANVSKRLIELDVDDTEVDPYKILPPSVRVYSVAAMSQLKQEVKFMQEFGKQIARDNQLKREIFVLRT